MVSRGLSVKRAKGQVPSAKESRRILSIKRTASLKTSLLNICLGCLASSLHNRFRKREISHSGKGQCPLCNFFQNPPYSARKDFDQFFSSVILAQTN